MPLPADVSPETVRHSGSGGADVRAAATPSIAMTDAKATVQLEYRSIFHRPEIAERILFDLPHRTGLIAYEPHRDCQEIVVAPPIKISFISRFVPSMNGNWADIFRNPR